MAGGAVKISWSAYHRHADKLAAMVKKDRFRPDVIVCISRGGLPLGLMLSESLKKPLGVITVQSYRGKKQGRMRFDTRISSIAPIRGRILLADDLVDSGKTIVRTEKYLGRFGTVRTAVMFKKRCSAFEPDYFAKLMPADKWIVFPYSKS